MLGITPGITLCAGSWTNGCPSSLSSGQAGISQLSFFWGSVDPWNKIGFCYTSTNCDYFYGSNLANFNIADPGGPDYTSAVVDFQATGNPWAYITFTSCGPNGICKPAFEIDNLGYTTGLQPTPGGAPTDAPEPSSLLLLGSGIAGLATVVRRKLRPWGDTVKVGIVATASTCAGGAIRVR